MTHSRFTKMGFRFSVLSILILCFFYVDARAQGHIIRGKVRNSSGANLAQITVSLESGNGALINQTVTNNEGDFIFGGLDDTSYIVTIFEPDFSPASERVEFVRSVNSNDPGETRTIEITLVGKTSRLPRAGLRFVQNIPKAAFDSFEQATRLLGNGRRQEAQVALETAIRLFPDYFDARFALANELIKQGKLDEAIKHLNEAQRINGKDDRVWYVFGTVLLLQRKYATAARVFAEAASLSPLDAQYPFMQGVALIDEGGMTQANHPQTASVRNYFFSEAEKALLRAYEMSGRKLAVVHLQLARLYEKKGDRSRAADELEKYLRSANVKNSAEIRDAIKILRARNSGKPQPPAP